MSTIPSASPRPSITLSSRRTSTSTTTADTTVPDRTALRRNKTSALRDYYGLQTTTGPTNAPSSPPHNGSTPTTFSPTSASEFDDPTFSAPAHVTTLLSRSSLAEILRTEANLLTEIRTLDGEKKALVYDNYSKLIGATETIARMRGEMGEGMGGTGTAGLEERVGRIAELAAGVEREMKTGGDDGGEMKKKREEKETVRWVLGAPERLGRLLREDGGKEEAEKEWKDVQALLDKWVGVKGVEEVRGRCLEAMRGADAGE